MSWFFQKRWAKWFPHVFKIISPLGKSTQDTRKNSLQSTACHSSHMSQLKAGTLASFGTTVPPWGSPALLSPRLLLSPPIWMNYQSSGTLGMPCELPKGQTRFTGTSWFCFGEILKCSNLSLKYTGIFEPVLLWLACFFFYSRVIFMRKILIISVLPKYAWLVDSAYESIKSNRLDHTTLVNSTAHCLSIATLVWTTQIPFCYSAAWQSQALRKQWEAIIFLNK